LSKANDFSFKITTTKKEPAPASPVRAKPIDLISQLILSENKKRKAINFDLSKFDSFATGIVVDPVDTTSMMVGSVQ